MAMNRIPFQHGMSLFEHFRQFGTAARSRPFSPLDGPRSTIACAVMSRARAGYKRETLFFDGYDVCAAATTGPFAGAQNGVTRRRRRHVPPTTPDRPHPEGPPWRWPR
jgi:hypothetical protein